eukprot:jgi/Botrbrau1/9014/Bobra.0148s0116.1
MNIEGMEHVPKEHQQQLLDRVDEMQIRDSLRMYNTLVERCFRDCVDSFRRKDLEAAEEKCVENCCEKFIKSSARVGLRFSELSRETEQEMMKIVQGK